MQPALPVLYARGGVCLAAPGRHLTVEQIGDLVDVFSELGVDKVRLTGGEPLLRREAADVVERLAANPDVRDLSMTTNGVLLAKQAESLRSAGLDRVTVSLDRGWVNRCVNVSGGIFPLLG